MRARQDSRSIVALAVTLGLGLVVAACGDESDPSPSLPDAPVTTEGGRGGGSIGGGGGGAVDTGSTTGGDVNETVEVMNTGLIFPSGGVDDRPMLAITGCAPGNTCTAQVSFTNTGDQSINATLSWHCSPGSKMVPLHPPVASTT
ncbi:MAG: hypothetical protein AAFX99_04255 [Myxococcota bacterium]